MKKLLWPVTATVLVALTMSSCMDLLNSDQFEKNRAQADDFFSFSTTGKVVLCLDYGKTGAHALVRLYGQDPIISQDGRSVLADSLVPLYQQFTDSEGKIFTEIDIPAHITDDVWLYSDFMALPQCEHRHIENGVIFNYRLVEADAPTKALPTRNVVSNPVTYSIGNGFHIISKWSNKYGGLNDINGVVSTGNLSEQDITAIKEAVWNGSSTKPSYFDNTVYADKESGVINTSITGTGSAEVFFTFVKEDGYYEDVIGYYFYPSNNVPASPDQVKKYIILPNASVSGNAPYGVYGFVADWGSYNAPASTNKRVQLLYEDSYGRMTPYFPAGTTIGYFILSNAWNVNGGSTLIEEDGTKSVGTRSTAGTKAITQDVYVVAGQSGLIDLGSYYSDLALSQDNYSCSAFSARNEAAGVRYIDINTWGSTGKATITASRTTWSVYGIPTTTIIGVFNIFVVRSQSEIPQAGERLPGSIDFSKPIYYSNREWNSGNECRCMARRTSEYIIYGFEDDVNKTFEDVVFTISANPKQAVLSTPAQDDIDINGSHAEKLKIGQRNIFTYCFEDLWPYQGDYDMNDVVIEHRSTAYFDNDNDLVEVVDSFTVCNEKYSSGKGVKDAFAVRISQDVRGSGIELPAGAYDEYETCSIILFEDAQENIGETFVIRRKFDKGTVTIDKLPIGTDMDPFIIPVMPDEAEKGRSCRDKYRREVHFPKKTGTSYIEPAYYMNDVEAFYVFRDNRHPFAISIPLEAAKTASDISKARYSGSMFVIPAEMGDIETQYTKSGHSYGEWVESGGRYSTDWYKYYSPASGEPVRTEMKRQ